MAGSLVDRLPWKLATPAMSAPDRASSSAIAPPKQKPIAPMREDLRALVEEYYRSLGKPKPKQ